jgi:hypothetical protein
MPAPTHARSTCARSLLAALAAFILAAPALAEERWLLLRATPATEAQLRVLVSSGWDARPAESDAAPTPFGTWWIHPTARELGRVRAAGIPHEVVHEDLSAFYRSRLRPPASGAAKHLTLGIDAGSMGGYFTFDEAIDRLDALQAAHPGLVAPKEELGLTVEGRSIWAYKLSANVAVDQNEPEILFISLMHAREPMGLTSHLLLAEHLVHGYGVDAEATHLLDRREIWIIPVLNADGYVHNQATNPAGGGLWRKNRSPQARGEIGVDLNRNFGFLWGLDDVGSSPDPASEVYRGTGPFSEPESEAVRSFVRARPISFSVNTHAHGDLLLRPWGHADLLTPQDAFYEEISRLAARETAYRLGNPAQAIGYLGNGAHFDYMHGEVVEKPLIHGVAPEIGSGQDGFWPGTDRIAPLATEMLSSHLTFAWSVGAMPRVVGVVVDDVVGGDGDGIPEPGEVVDLTVSLRNSGMRPTWGGLRATLSGPACSIVTSTEGAASDFGIVPGSATAANDLDPFRVRIASGVEPGEALALELSPSDDLGSYPSLPVELLVGEPTTLFADDLESGSAAWLLDVWQVEPAGAGRAGSALSDSPGGRYANGVDATAQLASALDLSRARHAYLEFSQVFEIDNDLDAGTVEVSWDGGVAWTSVAGRESDVGSGVGVQEAGSPVLDGLIADWSAERVDLSAYTGPGFDDVRIRFRLRSDGQVRRAGWRVDDVRVVAFTDPPAARSPPNEPAPLRVSLAGADVALSWPEPAADATHDPPDGYAVHRSPAVRGDGGFAPLVASLQPAALDEGSGSAGTGSFAYLVVATNCAGTSGPP